MKTIFRSLILFFFPAILPGIVNCQEKNELITRLKTQLILYRTQNSSQTIGMQTDKSLYRPGEEIWIKGYITDPMTHQFSTKGQEIIFQLTDIKGNIVNSNKFIVKDGMASGSLKIPLGLVSNLYTLTALTAEPGKDPPASSTGIDIYICRPESINLIPTVEFKEREGKAIVKLTDFSGKPLTGKRFDYSISSNRKVKASGKGKTTESGSGEITFNRLSNEPNSAIMLHAELPSGNEKIDFITHIPVGSEKIDVRFFPEGEKIVPGIPQRIVFEAKDQLWKPVNVDAEILSDKGEIVAKTTALQTGSGIFSMINPGNPGYKFRINSEPGKGQETSLPLADSSGMSISVRRITGADIELILSRSPNSKHSKFIILSLNKGEITWANEFELEESGIIKVPLDNFESEIGALAVFNPDGTLAGSRLIYTGKKPRIDVTVVHNQPSYSTGERGNLMVKLSGPDGKAVKGELSVSLSDKSACPVAVHNFAELNYGLENTVNLQEGESNMTLLNTYLIANQIKGLDWTKILAIDPSKPQAIKRDATLEASKEEIHEKVNEWKFLETFRASNYFNENPDFLKTSAAGKDGTSEKEAKVPNWKKYLENGGSLLEAIKMIHYYVIVNGKIIFRGLNSLENQEGALIVVDGIKNYSPDALSQIQPTNVEDIKVLLEPVEMSKYTSFNSVGIIEITTKRGELTKSTSADLHLPSDERFSSKPIGDKKYNLLTTLQWIPDLLTNEKGEAVIPFTTGNIKSVFILRIAGYTEKGEWFEKEVEFPVK